MKMTLDKVAKAEDVFDNFLTDFENEFDEDCECINGINSIEVKSFSLMSKGKVKEDDFVEFGIIDAYVPNTIGKYENLESESPSTSYEILLTIREAPSAYEESSKLIFKENMPLLL
jgi:hypothetical protein